jgi:hypothetical protein
MLSYAVVLGVNVCTTILWKQMGKNNVATLIWMFAPPIALAACQPINSFFSREVFFGGVFFFHVLGSLKYPLQLIGLPIVRRVCAALAQRESRGIEDTKKLAEGKAKRVKEGVDEWLDNVLAISLFYHMHLYVAMVVMLVQFTVQVVLALLEVLCGLHSAILLNSSIFLDALFISFYVYLNLFLFIYLFVIFMIGILLFNYKFN